MVRSFLIAISIILAFSVTLFSSPLKAQGGARQVQPWLGVEIDPEPIKDGILIKRVIPSAPAERAGFQGGDVIKAVDKEKIGNREGLMKVLRDKGVGATVKVHFTRKGKDESKELKLEMLPDMLDLAKANLIGKPAPDFAIETLETKEKLSPKSLKGKPYILEFWATWCPACRAAAPRVNEWAKAHPKIPVIGLSDEEASLITRFTKSEKLSYRMALDPGSKIQGAYGMGAIPAFILVGADGKVVDLTVGVGDYLEALLKKAESL